MKRRTLALLLAALGAAAVLLGILSATLWRASNVVTLNAERPGAPVVVTEPGVLAMMEGDVTITAAAEPDEPVELVVGHGADTGAWVAGSAHQKVTGAQDWHTLSVEETPADEGATAEVPSLFATDGWTAAQRGTQTAEITLDPAGQDLRALAIGDGTGPAPALTLSWQRDVETPWLWPGVILGALLLAGAIGLAVSDRRRGTEPVRDAAATGSHRSTVTATTHPATPTSVEGGAGGSSAVVDERPTTRLTKEDK